MSQPARRYNDHHNERELPNNIEAEQALLGAMLVNNEAFHVVRDIVRGQDFYEPLHRKIFEVASELIRMGKVANPVILKTFLPADEKVGEITVAQYLVRLMGEAVTVVNAPDYATGVRDLSVRRALIQIGERLLSEAYDMPVDANPEALGESTMTEIAEAISPNAEFLGATTFDTAVTAAIDASSQAYASDGQHAGSSVEYSFSALSNLIGPLWSGQLIILGGATKQGKTALAGQVAIGAARLGCPVWIYSGEMTPKELAMREISRDTKIPVWKQKRGELTEGDFASMIDFAKANGKLPIVIQNRRLTISGIKERAKAFVRKKGRALIIVDHIGLVERDKHNARMDGWQFGEEVTRELKAMARELDCPVIGCAQLKKNTFAEAKGPLNEKFLKQIVQRKPRYTDLIGGLERDADHVVIPFRPDVLLAEHEPLPGSDLYLVWETLMNEWRGRAKIVLALSREMQWPGSIDVGWDGKTTTFFETGTMADDRFVERFEADPMRLF
jgi:replicative DNA helicase